MSLWEILDLSYLELQVDFLFSTDKTIDLKRKRASISIGSC